MSYVDLGSIAHARAHMWGAQQRLGCFPECWIGINELALFSMKEPDVEIWTPKPLPGNALRVKLDDQLLLDILERRAHWNNAEIGCLIRFERTGPYLPDVHTMLSFFHIGR